MADLDYLRQYKDLLNEIVMDRLHWCWYRKRTRLVRPEVCKLHRAEQDPECIGCWRYSWKGEKSGRGDDQADKGRVREGADKHRKWKDDLVRLPGLGTTEDLIRAWKEGRDKAKRKPGTGVGEW